jgi:hypothetical protein
MMASFAALAQPHPGWDAIGHVKDVVAAGALVVGGVVVALALPAVLEQDAADILHEDLLTECRDGSRAAA